MARLLPTLYQISQQHPEPAIQGLASDLRAAIATRGAYRSDSVTNSAQYYSHSIYAQTKNKVTGQTKGNPVKPSGSSESPKSHVGQIIEMPHVIEQSPIIPSTYCSVSAQSTASVPLHSQNTVHLDTVSTSAQVKKQTQSFHHIDESRLKSFGLRPAASTCPSASTAPTPKKVFSDLLLEACDPDVPTRAMALRALTQCVKEGTKEALQFRDKLLLVSLSFQINEKQTNEFVYLYFEGLFTLKVFFFSFFVTI